MNKTNENLIFKGQPNGCPLLFNAIFTIALICLLPACSEKHNQFQIKKPHYKTFVNQAKSIDISTPVGFNLVKSDRKGDTTFFEYHGNQNIEKVVSFYNRELEVLGWEFKNLSTEQEGLFVCNKSSKTCVVSIRQNKSGSIICITLACKHEPN